MSAGMSLAPSTVLSRFNPFDPEQRRDPYGFYAEARAEGRLLRHPIVPILNAFSWIDSWPGLYVSLATLAIACLLTSIQFLTDVTLFSQQPQKNRD